MALKYGEITKKIIGCGMTVHTTLGNGFQEVIYQRCLAIEMARAGLRFSRELAIPVYYRQQRVGLRRVDFLVEETIVVELKAVLELQDAHLAQAKNYLEAFNLEVGLLMNFGAQSLEFHRVHNNKLPWAAECTLDLPGNSERG